MSAPAHAVPCAPWCQGGCGGGTECPLFEERGLNLEPAMGHRPVDLALNRNLSDEFRHANMPAADSCVVGLAAGGKHDDDPARWVELTPAEARELAVQLVRLADMADEDARALGRRP